MRKTKIVNIVLWILQGLLAFVFLFDGFIEVFTPISTLAQMFPWVPFVPASLIRIIGVCELLGAIGIIVPPIVRIFPQLTIAAAVGCMLVLASATIFHISLQEYSAIGLTIILFILAAIVVYGRTLLAPFPRRARASDTSKSVA